MKFILGKKIEMTQLFRDDGTVVPVTVVLATPNVVAQVKQKSEKDGYNAVQVGFSAAKKLKKAQANHLKGLEPVKTLKEFRTAEDKIKRGDRITVGVFAEGDLVKVTGTSKGKGYQGVVKRHGFHGQKASHGHKDQERMSGSIGAGGVQRVFKGVRMAGRMGDEQVTVSGLRVAAVDEAKNLLYIKGALPGSRHSLVMIYGDGEMDLQPAVVEAPIAEAVETPVEAVETPAATETPAEAVETPAAETAPEIAVETKEEVKAE